MIRNLFPPICVLVAFTAFASADVLLPVFHPGEVILFQGDSITDGGRQRTGSDFNHIMGQSYPYIIAAEIGSQYPERKLNFINRGVGGNTILDAAKRWQKDTLDLKPDLLSILFGVNDTFNKKESVADFEKTYDELLADTVAALPGTKIVLGQPYLLPVGKHKDNYADELAQVKLRQDAVGRLAEKYHLPVVAYQKALDDACSKVPAEYWSWDGIHPTYAGHGLMVHTWLQTVDAFWPKG